LKQTNNDVNRKKEINKRINIEMMKKEKSQTVFAIVKAQAPAAAKCAG
jgi:hypothetical protein